MIVQHWTIQQKEGRNTLDPAVAASLSTRWLAQADPSIRQGLLAAGTLRHFADGQRMPTTLTEAVDLLDHSAFARAAFGDRVVDHYVNSGRHEVTAFESAVTDWELVRSFERS